jgi:hypothetical protein
MIRALYTFLGLTFLPMAFILIFKTNAWTNFYSAFYFQKIRPRGGAGLDNIFKSFLALASSDLGKIIHQALGVLLTLISLWVFLKKLQILTFV